VVLLKIQVFWNVMLNTGCVLPDVSKDFCAFILRVKQSSSLGLIDTEDEVTTIL
jgi:hypothetical protein